MRLYTVHRPIDNNSAPPVLVREGFCWGACFFTILWAVYHRMWAHAGLVFFSFALVGAAYEAVPPFDSARGLATIGLMIVLGIHGNDWRRWSLRQRGYALEGVVGARDTMKVFTVVP